MGCRISESNTPYLWMTFGLSQSPEFFDGSCFLLLWGRFFLWYWFLCRWFTSFLSALSRVSRLNRLRWLCSFFRLSSG